MEARLSTKGQVVIPQEIRDELHMKRGQKLRIEKIGETVVIVPVKKNPVKAMRGLTKGLFKESSIQAVRKLRNEWK